MDIPYFVYPVFSSWTFGSFSFFGYYENCCNEQLCVTFLVCLFVFVMEVCFRFSWDSAWKWKCWSYGNSMLSFLKNYQLFQWLHHFTFSPAGCVSSNCSTCPRHSCDPVTFTGGLSPRCLFHSMTLPKC